MNNANRRRSVRVIASLVFGSCAALLLAATLAVAQSRPTRPAKNNSTKQAHTATLRASESPLGSRVAISSNLSLNDYEAYRRGDRFFVKIPAADVPRAELTRGRGFADVKVTRAQDYTIISFRLLPGATAHVEVRGNRLDVVFNTPGMALEPLTASNSGPRELARANKPSTTVKQPSSSTRGSNNSASVARSANPSSSSETQKPGFSSSGDKTGSQRSTDKAGSPQSSGNSSSPLAENKSEKSGAMPGATSTTPTPTPTSYPNATLQKAAVTPSVSPNSQSTPGTAIASSDNSGASWQSRLKERARYWVLLAQLNPVPVAIGAAVLALLLILLIVQRRRLKATRRVHLSKKAKSATASAAKSPTVAGVTDAAVAAVATPTSNELAAEPKQVVPIAAAVSSDGERQRVAAVGEQVKSVLAGGDYDQSVIGSNNPDTRQLVGAELLSAMVGRNIQRRERARDAFMNHGYFDDATRDLRTAEAPVERAAAARRLSFVHDREATPHLVAALDDSAPEVRRTAVEALMDLRDPAAIAPLHALMQTETDRKVPRTLIRHAIDACATSAPSYESPTAASFPPSAPLSSPPNPEREVIEI